MPSLTAWELTWTIPQPADNSCYQHSLAVGLRQIPLDMLTICTTVCVCVRACVSLLNPLSRSRVELKIVDVWPVRQTVWLENKVIVRVWLWSEAITRVWLWSEAITRVWLWSTAITRVWLWSTPVTRVWLWSTPVTRVWLKQSLECH